MVDMIKVYLHKQQIDLEKPIDDLIRTTTADMLNGISEPLKKGKYDNKTVKTKVKTKKKRTSK